MTRIPPRPPPTTAITVWIKSPISSTTLLCWSRLSPITSVVSCFSSPHFHSSFFVTSIAGTKYERARRGRLPKDQYFLKPTDLLPREDPFRRKRALLGPGAAESRRGDWFHQLDIDPLDEATNPRLLSYFVTDMGKMKSRAETKLTWRNQRRLTKAVRRAKMMGVMPILNKRVTSYHRDTAL
ncbi:hypothetical protein EDB92DRAFT_942309 [Lactarius akahatsu]|uniref:Small ribosomal subunit protein bS18m n=1 Tax=Lactarius akahatsu TaxID=416441 RepID=A0AAD4LTZ8_9AGAM|nr:hypothetical protein EDB92DRAFT_942309 [Lactarius akahatsu]